MTIYNDMRSDASKAALSQKVMILDVDDIEVNPLNTAPIEGIEELMEFIQATGGSIVEPITVYKVSNRKYRLLSGERRLTASKRLGIETIKANIMEKPATKGEEIELIDRFNASRPQTEAWNKIRVQSLSEAYDDLSLNGHIEKGVRKTEWISLRMHGVISARTVQEYLTGKYASAASSEAEEKVKKPLSIKKISKTMKKLHEALQSLELSEMDVSYKDLNEFEHQSQELFSFLGTSGSDIYKAKHKLIEAEERKQQKIDENQPSLDDYDHSGHLND